MAYFTSGDLPTHFVDGPAEVRPAPARVGGCFVCSAPFGAARRLGVAARSTATRYSTSKMRSLFKTPAVRDRLPVALLLAVARRESGFKPWVTSSAGAQGLMQIMPRTGAELANSVGKPPTRNGKPDYFLPTWNTKAGSRYLRHRLNKTRDVRDALAAYVWGPGNVQRKGGYYGKWLRQSDGSYRLSRAPASVRKYVDDVLKNYVTFGGSAAWLKANTRYTQTPTKPGTKPATPTAKKPKPKAPAPLPVPSSSASATTTESGSGDGAGFLFLGLLAALALGGGLA